MQPTKYRPSFVPNIETIHWDRITDARVGYLLKQATLELIRINDEITDLERERDQTRSAITDAWATADVLVMRNLNARYRDIGRRLSNRHYWRLRVSEQIALIAKERRRMFGAKPNP